MEAAIAILGRFPRLALALTGASLAGLLAALSWGGIEAIRVGSLEDELAAQKADARAVLERTRATYAAEAAQAADERASESARRVADQKEIDRETTATVERARSAAVAAAAADADRKLRERFAAIASAACRGAGGPDSASAGVGPAEPPADVVPADVFAGLVARGREAALALDISHAEGIGCERAADSLRTTP